MPEKPITQKVIQVVKELDKTWQDVEKGLGRIVLAGKELVDIFRKPNEPE